MTSARENQAEEPQTPGSQWDANRTAGVALGMFLAFAGLVVVLHFLRPDLPPLTTFISDYATGRFGFLMIVAFLAFAVGLATLVISLYRVSPFGSRPWATMALFSVASLLLILVALFRSDPPGAPQTTAGEIHDQVSGLFFLVMIAAMLIFSVRLWRAGRLIAHYRALLWLAAALPVLLVAAFTTLDSIGLVGLGQRIFVAAMLGWLMITAYGLRTGSLTGKPT